jgi:cell fate regulator YaaT (PSP1 superfamily)
LGDFEPVSIKMAKEQNLSLNPTKISGICGRLMCCLKFECDQYRTGEQRESSVGVTVTYQGRRGVIVEENPEEETVVLEFPDEERLEIPITEIEDYAD